MDLYQDALHPDRVDRGERDCLPRWELIRPHVPTTGMILDVGSNLGYYGLKASGENVSVAVVSMEPEPSTAERQRRLLKEHGTTRICLIQGAVDASLAAQWAETCDWFELTLLLAVLHWTDDPGRVVRALSSMSGVLIAEVPDSGDRGACGQSQLQQWADPIAWFREHTGRNVTHLGRVPRHTSSVPSHVIMISGPISREPTVPYWDYIPSHGPQRDAWAGDAAPYQMRYDGERIHLAVRGEDVAYRPGVNIVSLMHLGRLLHPQRAYWIQGAAAAVESWPEHGDPMPHNMLWTPSGLSLVDGNDQHLKSAIDASRRSMKHHVTAWATTVPTSAVPYRAEWLSPYRRLRRGTGRALLRLVGRNGVARIKGLFGPLG